jgi:hypothetical protein
MKLIKNWLKLYQDLRTDGNYPMSDDLREMLRRMGYEIRVTKNSGEVSATYYER